MDIVESSHSDEGRPAHPSCLLDIKRPIGLWYRTCMRDRDSSPASLVARTRIEMQHAQNAILEQQFIDIMFYGVMFHIPAAY